MAEFIPMISITEFKKLKVWQLKQLKSCEVYSDGDYLFTFVNGHTEASGYLRKQTEYNCETSNSVGGLSLAEILEESQCPA